MQCLIHSIHGETIVQCISGNAPLMTLLAKKRHHGKAIDLARCLESFSVKALDHKVCQRWHHRGTLLQQLCQLSRALV
jgi:hypothetical protein